ncbi:MAG TPA: serine hydrolase, partial [Vicinamibacterales bacterium]|nr:serine hydrolase [Vicinamibacterales bacterium]
ARAREAARLRALREAMTPRWRLDAQGSLVPDVRAAAAIVMNPETGEILYAANEKDQRSIASITKVMTALVFLEDEPDLSQQVTIVRSDTARASHTYLRVGERVRAEDLLHLALVASDNAAARALARTSHGGTEAFVRRMNEKALELGLEATAFADPSGLSPANVSSAYDVSRLIAHASNDERLAAIMRLPEYRVQTSRRSFTIRNTNQLLGGGYDVRGGKTGFIASAGYCFATMLRLPQGQPLSIVVLGARTNALRFFEVRHLVDWISRKFQNLFSNPADRD